MNRGNYFAFDPNLEPDKDYYVRTIRLISTIYEVLNDYNINTKCKGYTFMKDAICIITDLQRMDICLAKEVYPLIADKYDAGGIYTVEHGIRNALNAAYLTSGYFISKPTNKTFLLMAAQEVSERLLKELCV